MGNRVEKQVFETENKVRLYDISSKTTCSTF